MKTWNIEVQKVKAMAHGHGLIRAQIDALVQPAPARDEGIESSILSLSEDNARVLVLLLKAQLTELDSRKPKSRRS
jgi:hypothetical protein